MIQELNLTPKQTLILIVVLLLILAISRRFKSYVVIDIEEDKQQPTRPLEARYGAFIQSQGKYHN
ncbi:hypothetical protein BOVMAS02_14740 [Streptococcus uberis]|uniref:hypothetical protein n=1 Tax=Streptococcus uberis TaxID=1349 RepID=UPI0027DAC038|nr:hypothetical protein [Streptococcus uberis]MCK1192978.1 hypothetical protein [Streptococcus uberis]MCK1244583.1 hypothetical protein [Streptococcus uberis]MCK1246867.1 hypothetical protein [Streptococcus uberis]